MLNWAAAVDRLHHISKEHLVRFLNGPEKDDVYGIGAFCDANDGSVYLVANTEQHFRASLREFVAQFGQTDPEVFKWNIGNWKYPSGLFPSSSAEQLAFDTAWQEYREALSQIESDNKQAMLEDTCARVLARLFEEGDFLSAPGLIGLTILGPDDASKATLEKKKRFDGLMRRNT